MVMDDLLYPEQAVDGLVHARGASKLKKALEARADARREEAKRGEAFFTKLVNGTQEPPPDEPRRPGPCCVVV